MNVWNKANTVFSLPEPFRMIDVPKVNIYLIHESNAV